MGFTHSIIVVVTISLWKTSLKCQGKLEEIVIAYHLKFHISYYSNTQKLPPLRDMTESRHMLQEHKLRWGWKICCNQNSSSSSFSDLKLSLSWGIMNSQKNQSFSVHWFSHLPWGETWLINLLFVLRPINTFHQHFHKVISNYLAWNLLKAGKVQFLIPCSGSCQVITSLLDIKIPLPWDFFIQLINSYLYHNKNIHITL